MTRRYAKEDNTGELLMKNKHKESRKEERTFRKEKSRKQQYISEKGRKAQEEQEQRSERRTKSNLRETL